MADKKYPLLIQALNPAHERHDADELDYPDLKAVIDEFYSREYKNVPRFWEEARPLSDKTKQNLYQQYLLLSAQKLQEADTHKEKVSWTRRFTDASKVLYGEPQLSEVAAIAKSELDYFQHAGTFIAGQESLLEPLIEQYHILANEAGTAGAANVEGSFAGILPAANDYFTSRYASALNCFNAYMDDSILTVKEVVALYNEALAELARQDPAWSEWSLRQHDGASMSVVAAKKIIKVGRFLPPISLKRSRALFAHEVLVHAQRSINGAKCDSSLSTGLPGYLPAEEGFAILAEASMLGHVPHRVKDRYIDMALALGTGRRHPMSRPELFGFAYARAAIRERIEGEDTVSKEVLRRLTWQHVNRLYRGTLGNQYVGVFTRDIVYYAGLKDIIRFIGEFQGSNGEVFDFLLQGKFNPCIDTHVAYVRSAMKSI